MELQLQQNTDTLPPAIDNRKDEIQHIVLTSDSLTHTKQRLEKLFEHSPTIQIGDCTFQDKVPHIFIREGEQGPAQYLIHKK